MGEQSPPPKNSTPRRGSLARPDEGVRAHVALHGGLCARLLGCVFRRALGLQLFGVEDAVAAKAAIGQSLGVIFKSIRRRFGPAVNHGQKLIVFYQRKFNSRTRAFDRTGLDIPGHPQMPGVSAVTHAPQFLDGDVITLALLYPGVRQITHGEQDQRHRPAEFEIFPGFARHK